jgi:hypothetical protein
VRRSPKAKAANALHKSANVFGNGVWASGAVLNLRLSSSRRSGVLIRQNLRKAISLPIALVSDRYVKALHQIAVPQCQSGRARA